MDPTRSRTSPETPLVEQWVVATNPRRTGDDLAMLFGGLVRSAERTLGTSIELTGLVIASEVPETTTELRRMAVERLGLDPVVVGPGVKTGLSIRYEAPQEVGADRVANAVGALERYGAPCIVVAFGTGTTFDVIAPDRAYAGGAIAPGVVSGLDGLFGRAAALRRAELTPPRSVIGRTTADAIRAGVLLGAAAMAEGMTERISEELGTSATIVATGGLADLVLPHTEAFDHHDPWITLHGLRLIWEKNR